MSFIKNLDTKDLVTLIGIVFTFIVSILNLINSSNKNKVDFVSQNRMDWINSVRNITNEIISWRFYDSPKDLLKMINKLILYLNISNEIDNKIITQILKMYDFAYKLSFYQNDLKTNSAKKTYESYYTCKQNVNTLIRIYLKKEWTRIKAESRVLHIPFFQYWIPLAGFNEKWATKSLMKKYDKIRDYEFKPWIEFSIKELEELNLNNITETDDARRSPIEFDAVSYGRRMLKESLLSSDAIIVAPDGKIECSDDSSINRIKVPDGKFA